MVLIISENRDFSTSVVIDWLLSFGTPFLRINEEDSLEILNIDTGSANVLINGATEVDLYQIQSIWYRRGFLNFKHLHSDSWANKTKLEKDIEIYLKQELTTVHDFITWSLVNSSKSIGSFQTSEVNKLHILQKARESGLETADYIITGKKSELQKFKEKHRGIVTKPINRTFSCHEETCYGNLYTEEVSQNDINDLEENFFPTFFQKKIEKKYELRVFFLKDSFFAMAIFSQLDQQTRIDFRKYNDAKPNRWVPFLLPTDLEVKLTVFMESCRLDTGSIDLIVTQDDRIIFLEVNPVGQFGMVSRPCNYYLEKKIAELLI